MAVQRYFCHLVSHWHTLSEKVWISALRVFCLSPRDTSWSLYLKLLYSLAFTLLIAGFPSCY